MTEVHAFYASLSGPGAELRNLICRAPGQCLAETGHVLSAQGHQNLGNKGPALLYALRDSFLKATQHKARASKEAPPDSGRYLKFGTIWVARGKRWDKG